MYSYQLVGLVEIVCALILGCMAAKEKQSVLKYALLGLLFGPIGFLFWIVRNKPKPPTIDDSIWRLEQERGK